MVDGSNKIEFGYKHEEDYGYNPLYRTDVTIIGNAFAFSYYGFLFFSCVIEHPPYPAYYPGTYYQLWARFDPDAEPGTSPWETWYNTLDEKPKIYNIGAIQVDSLLHMLYCDWNVSAYGFPCSIGKDVYTFDPATRKIVFKAKENLSLPGKSLGGMFTYQDTAGYTNFIYNTNYSEFASAWVTHHRPPFPPFLLSNFTAIGSVVVQGSAQGKRENESSQPEKGNRFNVFDITPYQKPDGSYPLYNVEYVIPEDITQKPYVIRNHEIVLPTVASIQGPDLGLSTKMTAMDFILPPGYDGLAKVIQIFYPDDDGIIHGAFFNSDIWRPVPGSVISSTDLQNDSLYGPEIRKLWTLVGITDGAPPCSIEWEAWDSTLNLNQHKIAPTELEFSFQESKSVEVKSIYEDTYTFGTKIDIGIEEIATLGFGFEYSNCFKSLVSSSHEVTTKLTQSFGLNYLNQEHGYYFWNIPNITRTSYMVYPWYDNGFAYPIPNSFQYQFITNGSALHMEEADISAFPFQINEPNEETLHDFTQEGRAMMYADILSYGAYNPIKTLYWLNGINGQNWVWEGTNDSTVSLESKNTYKWEETAGFGIPAIFTSTTHLQQEVSYSAESTCKTKFGTEVKVSLDGLELKTHGINFSEYYVDIYWFKPEEYEWWYLDSTFGHKPWYLAYMVKGLHSKLLLSTPQDASHLKGEDLLFTWQVEGEELKDFELFITNFPAVRQHTLIYSVKCGNMTAANLKDFSPEPGVTYFWTVRGFASDGTVVWSETRSFIMGKDQPDNPGALLKATIYPNPARDGQVCVAYDLPEAGRVSVYIYDINGHLLQQSEQAYHPAGIITEQFEIKDYAPGIYIVLIQTGKANVTRKLVIR
ncbi:MAG: T9SS type A sorting domain-containing protein, partial [Bacteroidales bacterium]